ncbi:chymotrypsinogen 2 [Anopheles darlingi]|uniref:Chymotrypsinogen 2 n=1 Tax=Anopheles darlingi TaxID=43151 RepID=W5J951_ANODA|nr:chymotrypsinogen 2 [Anopheles darlingi]
MELKYFSFVAVFVGVALGAPTELLSESDRRIVNGTDTTINNFPFMVSLRGMYGDHMCGGSILSEFWILTGPASRAVDNFGSDYNPDNSHINDIALLKLYDPLQFSAQVSRARLPQSFSEITDPNDLGVTLIGWGLTATGGSVPKTLQRVDYYIVPNAQCAAIHRYPIYPSHICAATPGGGKGQCSGDSGGPLLHHGVQLGIVSWSVKPCAIAPYPGVLTKVSHHIAFIEQYTSVLH